jgi:hypothetical protein
LIESNIKTKQKKKESKTQDKNSRVRVMGQSCVPASSSSGLFEF